MHVADYIAFPRFHRPRGPGIKARSCIRHFRRRAFSRPPPNRAYYGDDAANMPSVAASRLLKTAVPLLIAYAELDPPENAAESKP